MIDSMINAMNDAEPAVFAIMDYWSFDGWFALKHRLSQPDAPVLNKTVFPGIELRLVAPMDSRLNAHVLFSNEIDDQILKDFKSELKIALIDRSLSDYSLRVLARQVGTDLLKSKGYSKEEVDKNDEIALEAGSKIAEITCESYKTAIKNVPSHLALGFMPFNTNDGLANVKWQEHYAYVLGLFETSPIFETRSIDSWAAFAGIETDGNKNWIQNFQSALKNTPRLAVSGSDAHLFIGQQGNNDKRGYGDFPSGKITWIKGDPTFEGLKQAIKEPAKRSFIGEIPPKLKRFRENKSLFIDKLKIEKIEDSKLAGKWLDQTDLCLNPDLIAIIGNKGSGKSALADIVALLGNSKQSLHFSFLKESRFRGKTGEPAKHFSAQIDWADGTELKKNLAENPALENVELVKYIPQGHFEELCNAHVTGQSDVFENELRTVIFSHADDSIRLGAMDFDQLIEQQESSFRNQLYDLRLSLQKLNRQIASFENQMSSETRKAILELLVQQQRLIDEHEKIKPVEALKPTEELTPEQISAGNKIIEIAQSLDQVKVDDKKLQEKATELAAQKKACKNIRDQIGLIKRTIQTFFSEVENDSKLLGLDMKDIFKFEVDEKIIEDTERSLSGETQDNLLKRKALDETKNNLIKEQSSLSSFLNEPQLVYQKYLDDFKIWEDKKNNLLGSLEKPDTLLGLQERLSQIDKLPQQRANLQQQRLDIARQIFDILDEQRLNRETLFQPVQQLIQGNKLIREDYRLQFIAKLDCTPELISNQLFNIVKQNAGEFKGESDSVLAIKNLFDKHDFNSKNSLLNFVIELSSKLEQAASGKTGINSLLRKNRTANEVYDYLFGLSYLQPRYTLMFQGANIGQLSPGQRGALLLIFYLLVDKGNTPIILDQPEENLDNETIVSLLVPVLNEAKQTRQIIMVTHNPNLAVVCDAEQIIYCHFDRKNDFCISYVSGAIECGIINRKVVDVLEGTMPAFDNRKMKYN